MVEKPEMRREAIALYSALQPEDATDSIFVRLMVAMANNVFKLLEYLAPPPRKRTGRPLTP